MYMYVCVCVYICMCSCVCVCACVCVVTLLTFLHCTRAELDINFALHCKHGKCCTNSDGTLSLQPVTRVGMQDAWRSWFGTAIA